MARETQNRVGQNTPPFRSTPARIKLTATVNPACDSANQYRPMITLKVVPMTEKTIAISRYPLDENNLCPLHYFSLVAARARVVGRARAGSQTILRTRLVATS